MDGGGLRRVLPEVPSAFVAPGASAVGLDSKQHQSRNLMIFPPENTY
jgi:hypothetical protein